MTRRNPQARRPHRRGGPPAPPDPKTLAALARAAEREAAARAVTEARAAKAQAKRVADAAKAEFRARRGCPPGTAQVYIDLLRKQGGVVGRRSMTPPEAGLRPSPASGSGPDGTASPPDSPAR